MNAAAQLLLTFLLNALWLSVLVAGFAMLCSWLLRDTAARYRHALWVAALVLSLVLPLLSCMDLIRARFVKERPAAPTVTEPACERIVRPLVLVEMRERERPAGSVDVMQPTRSISPIQINRRLAFALVGLYALFVLFRATKLFRAWMRTCALIRSSYPVVSLGPLQEIIQNCQGAIGVKRLRVRGSSFVAMPITAGVVRPLVILPEQLLRETDRDVLTSAIGHELVHIARWDYVLNLIYEFLYLPLSFHPAAALLRRSIKRTRELCCDERVAERLIDAQQYARSLVRLIGSAPLADRLVTDTTIGVAESDILEVRIMSLLRKPKLTARRKTLLFVAASLLLITPCVAGAKLALRLNINAQEPATTAPGKVEQKLERKQDQERQELKRLVQELKEQARVAPEAERREIETRLREVEQDLAEHERLIQEYNLLIEPSQEKMRQTQEALAEMSNALAQAEKNAPGNRARIKDLRDTLAQLENLGSDAKLRPEQLEELLRLGDEIELQQKQQGQKEKEKSKLNEREMEERPKIEEREMLERRKLEESELQEQRKIEEREMLEKRKMEEGELKLKREGQEYEMKRLKGAEEREERGRRQAELTKGANISMDRAIQIATSKYPGKVLACSLGRERDGYVFYHLIIISGDGDKNTATYVWVSAVDGQIIKAEKE